MVTSKDCLIKYGLPYDEVSTSVNESTQFEGKWMKLWDIPSEINIDIPVLPNKIYCNKIFQLIGLMKNGSATSHTSGLKKDGSTSLLLWIYIHAESSDGLCVNE